MSLTILHGDCPPKFGGGVLAAVNQAAERRGFQAGILAAAGWLQGAGVKSKVRLGLLKALAGQRTEDGRRRTEELKRGPVAPTFDCAPPGARGAVGSATCT